MFSLSLSLFLSSSLFFSFSLSLTHTHTHTDTHTLTTHIHTHAFFTCLLRQSIFEIGFNSIDSSSSPRQNYQFQCPLSIIDCVKPTIDIKIEALFLKKTKRKSHFFRYSLIWLIDQNFDWLRSEDVLLLCFIKQKMEMS